MKDKGSSYDLIITGGRLIGYEPGSPRDSREPTQEIAIRDGRIARVAPRIEAPAKRRIDARGLCVLPGLIDPHVHLSLSMKGTISSDDVDSGTAAAIYGGVTTVIDFTLQHPGESLAESLCARMRAFDGKAHTDYALHVCVTDFPADIGAALDEVVALGGTSFKVFTCYSREGMAIGQENLQTLLRETGARGLLVLLHAEDDAILQAETERLWNAGETGPAGHPVSRPPAAEARAIADSIAAARAADAPVYFVHVSTAQGLQAITAARQGPGMPIYAETCPQYLLLDDSAYLGLDAAQFMVAPPLRPAENKAALLDAVVQGDVDVVATDHCPFRRAQKEVPGAAFTEIPNGLPGIETRLPLVHTATRDRLSLDEIVALLSRTPARIMGLYPQKGVIRRGSDADLVLFDPDARWELRALDLHMKTDFSPYEGFPVQGRVETVLLRGNLVLEDGKLRGRRRGEYLQRTPRI